MEDLYIDQAVSFEKIAAEVSLPEDAAQWPQEIMQELYKQVPYVADFHPDVTMETVNAEQGYGFGHFEVQNQSEAPTGTTPEQEQNIGIQHVRIPIIVKDFKLQPFDVLITADSKMLPLTESRLRQALFRPQAFDVTSRTPGDQSLVGQLYPPYRQNYGFGGGGMVSGGDMGKTSSAPEAWLGKEAEEASKKDLASRIADTLGVDPKSVEHLDGKKKQAAPSYPVSDAALRSTKIKDVVPKMPQQEKQAGFIGGVTGAIGAKDGDRLGGAFLAGAPVGGLASIGTSAGLKHLGVDPIAAGIAGSVMEVPAGMLAGRGYSKLKDVVLERDKQASILSAIKGTVHQGDYEKVAFVLAQPDVYAAYLANSDYTGPSLRTLASFEPRSVEKTASAYSPAMRPDVMQLRRTQEGYVLKTACSHAWLPMTQDLDRGQAVQTFGEKVVLAADASGAVTMEEGPSVSEQGESPADVKPAVVTSFGLYKVQSQDGRDLVGFVIPNLIDIDATSLPIALFTNGSEAALQGEIVGEPAGTGGNLPTGPAQGQGIFYRMLPNGVVEATVPLNVQGGVGDGQVMAQTFDGRSVTVAVQPRVKRPVAVEGTLILPEGFVWSPMGEANEVQLVEAPEQFHKQSAAQRKFASVVVRAGSESSFSFDGIPLAKVAAEDKSFLGYDDAIFLLAGLGTDARYGATKLAEAVALGYPVEVRIGRHLTPIQEALETSTKTASALLQHIPRLKVDLVKEAAFVPDPTAVDTILSLGFINPENIRTFVGYLPKLEDVVSKLCELLIGARMGIRDLPVGALEKCIRSMEDVIEGLKTMAFVGQD